MPESADDVLDELASLPTMAHPIVSPDGDQVALYYDITGRNEVHVLDVDNGELDQWSDGDVPRNARWYLDWDEASERIFYHDDEAGNEQNDIYAIDADGTVESIVEIDGQAVVGDVGEEYLYFGCTRDGQMNIYRCEFATGEVSKLTDYDRAVASGSLSPDESQLAYSTNETDDFDNRDVYVANADGSEPTNLEIGDVGAEAHPVDWRSDGEALLVMDNSPDMNRVGVYELDTETVTWYSDGEYDEEPVGFLPDDSAIIATRDREAGTIPIVYDTEDGSGRELDVPEGVANFGLFNPAHFTLTDGRIVFQHTTPTRRPELLAYDLETDDYEVLLEAEYGSFEAEDFVDAEFFTFESDGVPDTPAAAIDHDPYDTLEIGALFFDAGERPSPLVVNPHGGPRARDEKAFDLYTQVLAMRGYSVLQVNYRGSTGRGREFIEELFDDWGGAEQGDVATGAEHVLDEYDWLDEDRVAVFGGSYGGYSTYWQLVQYPDLYDAGIAWIGVTELEDQYENTMPHFKTELMEKYLGTPDENPDLYRERSPVTHVDNLDAPVLIVHGVNDRRVPISQARIFREAIESAGYEAGEDADFEYQELGEEGHASTDQDQKLRMFRLLDGFLARRLDGE
jgi:dipeptidyl aminopeptidase/acylaminoacyl peptidase